MEHIYYGHTFFKWSIFSIVMLVYRRVYNILEDFFQYLVNITPRKQLQPKALDPPRISSNVLTNDGYTAALHSMSHPGC